MNNKEAFHLLEMIADAYMIDFKSSQIDLWLGMLTKDGNYKKSKIKLENHINSNKFPPRIADFKVRDEHNPADDFKKQIEEDRRKVEEEMKDPEIRKRRQENLKRMQQLMARLKEDNDE